MFGRRIGSGQLAAGGSGSEVYFHDGDQVFLQLTDEQPFVSLHGDITDQVFARINLNANAATPRQFYLTDHLGSVVRQVWEDGATVRKVRYHGYGRVHATIDEFTVGGHLEYAGREFDYTTGLQYNRARWYDPQAGRFLSEDPLGQAADIHPYRYVYNSPTHFTDPSGGEPVTLLGYTVAQGIISGIETLAEVVSPAKY